MTKGSALSNLPDIPAHSREATLSSLAWTPRQLTVGIIWCEEQERDPSFSIQPNTLLNEYIPRGKKLNRQ